MKKIIFLIAIFAFAALQNQAQSKIPDEFRITCTGEQIEQLSIVIYSRKSSGKFVFKDRQNVSHEGNASVLYPFESSAGISFETGRTPGTKDSELLGILRYDNDGMILNDAESHRGILRWKPSSDGAKFLNSYDPSFDRNKTDGSKSNSKQKNRYDEFAVTCKAK